MTAELVSTHSFDRQVARLVKLAIFDSGKTQKEVALAAGINPGSMSLGMKGQRPWRAEELVLIASATGVAVTDLLPHLDSNQKPFGNRGDYWHPSMGARCYRCGAAVVEPGAAICLDCTMDDDAVVVDLDSYRERAAS